MTTPNRCYICYEPTAAEEQYHPACLKQLFNTEQLPELAFKDNDIATLALELVKEKKGLPGVQEKLSLSLQFSEKNIPATSRLTIVGYLGGEYIFKPPTTQYPHMPEIEDLTMHLAAIAKIQVAQHGLIAMHNDTLAYITKRFDRNGQQKIAVEDFCQLSEKLTENKYKGSYEQLAKIIAYYASIPGEEILKFFELILFNFLVGNADMHLKNFSLITQDLANIVLAPSYDLLSTRLLISEHDDPEELALPLNGKKRNIRRNDFVAFGKNLNIPEKVIYHTMQSMIGFRPQWEEKIKQSFLPTHLREKYLTLIDERCRRIDIT